MCYQSDLADVQPKIKGFIISRVFNASDALDILQDVNTILIEKEPDFKQSGNFDAWAMTITKYQIMAYMTTKKRRKNNFSLENSKSAEVINLSVEEEKWLSDAPFSSIVGEELANLKAELLSTFTPFQRDVFRLVCQGYSNSQVAEKLNKSYSSIQIAKYRLVKQAQNYLKNFRKRNKYDY